MKIVRDEGPLRIEDHDDKYIVVHKASGEIKSEMKYRPGDLMSATCSYSRVVGFCEGWDARKRAQYMGKD